MTEESATTIASRQKAGLLHGLLTREQLQLETGWGWRTILRREADGLPVIVIGGTKLYPANKVRAWILAQVRRRPRPPSSAAPRRLPPLTASDRQQGHAAA